MFPFTYKKTFVYDVSGINDFNPDLIKDSLISQLDIISVKQNKIDFYDFHRFYKRHRWLSEGSIIFNIANGKLNINLNLLFFLTPLVSIAISIYLVIANFKLKQFPSVLIIVGAIWLVYIIMYVWTSLTYKLTINNTVKRKLYEMNPIEESFRSGNN